MCALVLALRKVPVYAPGGGGAALGSSDSPSYSVAVSDAEAANARAAFSQAKEGKRLVPTAKAANRSSTSGTSSDPTPARPSSPGDLRARSGTVKYTAPVTEANVILTLNSRPPASDPAHDWVNDDNNTASPSTPQGEVDRRRSNDIEEVRGMLSRNSTRGKRKNPVQQSPQAPNSSIPTIREPTAPIQYHDYAPSVAELGPKPNQPPLGLSMPNQGANDPFGGNGKSYANPYQPQMSEYPSPLQTSPPRMHDQQQQIKRPVPGGNSFAQEQARRESLGARERKNSFA